MTTKSALMVWGGWDGHVPDEATALFAPWLEEQGYDVEVSDTLTAYDDLGRLKALDLVVPVWTQGTVTQEQEHNLLEAIWSGVGVAGWHGCMADSFRMSTDYQFMVGGPWVAHPGGSVDHEVNILDTDDPITAGLSDFKLQTEQYYMHVDPNNEVLATTTFDGEQSVSGRSTYDCSWIRGTVMPVVWKRMWGRGRVFYCSIGHKIEDLLVPEANTMIKRGMLWASRPEREQG